MDEKCAQQPDGKKKKGEPKEHHCSVCGKLSPATICHACEDKVRGEAVEHKRDIEKT
jgi:recombinational DNA repair protein RecR